MSTTVDQRIVEMRFDNKNFENNVRTTMSTLDKFKEKLHLKGASKGLEDVNVAARKVDMSGLSRGIETVNAKFSAMQVVGTTALVNLTNTAMRAGENMVKALTIDPVKTGLSEYETKMNAVQVIKANTRGKNSMDEIVAALEELNLYADKTIYNFAQMTNNVGKFVAQGLDIKQATNAAQGLANLAGASGASAEDMARATYQMSQALSGTIRKIDWNSLRNANMATVELKNTLIDLAKVNGIAIDDMIAKHGTFEDTLQDGWLTGSLFTEAMNIYSDVYSEAELKAKGFTDEQVKNFKDLAKTASEATTEVKTMSQLWDVLKETAQSGWTQSWEIIFGDFDTAKAMWTNVQNYLSEILNAWSTARNFVLEGAFNFAKPWKNIAVALSNVQGVVEKVTNFTDKLEYFQEVVSRVWQGVYKNSDTGRYELLEKAGYNHKVVQDLVNKGRDYKITVDDIKASHEKFGLTLETNAEETDSIVKSLENLDEETLRHAGLTEEEIQLYKDLAAEANRTGTTVEELANRMSTVSGRALLIDSVKNAWSGLLGIATALKDAFVDIFPPMTAPRLYTIIEAVNKFSESLRLTDKETGELTDTAQKLQRIFKGIFAVIDIAATILSGGVRIAFEILSEVLAYFGTDVITVAAEIADMLVSFRDWAKELIDIKALLDKIVPPISNFIQSIKNLVKEFLDIPEIQTIIENVVNAFNKLSDIRLIDWSKISAGLWTISSFFTDLPIFNGLAALTNTAAVFGSDLANGVFTGFKEFDWGKLSAIFWDISALLPNAPIFNVIAAIANSFAAFASNIDMPSIGLDLTDGLVIGIINGVKNVINAIVTLATELIKSFCDETGVESPSKVFMAIGGFIVAGLLLGLTGGISSVSEALKNIANKCIEVFNGIEWGTIFAIGLTAGGLVVLKKFADTLANLTSPLIGFGKILDNVGDVVGSFSKILNSVALNIKTKALKNVVVSLAILVGCVAAIALLCDDPMQLFRAVLVVSIMVGALIALMWAMNQMESASVSLEKGKRGITGLKTGLLNIGIALLAIAGTMAILGKMDSNEFNQGAIGLGVALSAMLGFLFALQLFTKNGADENISKIGGMMIKLGVAMLLMAGVMKIVGKLSPGEMIKGGLFAAAFVTFTAILTDVAKGGLSKNISKIGGMMLKLSIAMMLMVGVLKIIKLLTVGDAIRGVIFVTAFTLFVKGLVKATLGAGKNIGKIGGSILAISLAMIALIGVCKLLKFLDINDVKNGVIFAAAFLLFTKMLILVSKGAGKNIGKLGITMLALSGAVMMMALIATALGFVPIKHLAKGIIAVALLSAIFGGLVLAAKGLKNVTGTLIVMTVAIGLLAIAAAALCLIPTEKLKTSVASLSILLGAFALIVGATKFMKNTKAQRVMLVEMLGVVAALGLIVAGLSYIAKPETALKNTAALSLLLVAFSSALWVLSKTDRISTTVNKMLAPLLMVAAGLGLLLSILSWIGNPDTLIHVAVSLGILLNAFSSSMLILGYAGGVKAANVKILDNMLVIAMGLGALIGVLSLLPNPQRMIPIAISIGILLNAFSAAMIVLGLAGGVKAANVKILDNMFLIAVGLGALLGVLSLLPNPQNMLPIAISLGVLLNAFSASMVVLGLAGKIDSSIIPPLVIMTLAAGVLGTLLGLLSLLPNPQNMIPTAIGLGILLAAFSASLVILSHVGTISQTIYGPMFALVGVVALLAIVLGALEGFDVAPSIETAVALSIMLLSFSAALGILALIGPIATAALPAMGVLALLIAGLGAILVAIGALNEYMGGDLEKFINEGIPILLSIGEALGGFFGNIIGSFVEVVGGAIGNTIAALGEDIAEFMKWMSVAAAYASTIEPTAFDGAKAVLDIIGDIALTMLGTQFADLFIAGGTAIDEFQRNAEALFKALGAISKKLCDFALPGGFKAEDVYTLLDVLSAVGLHMVGNSFTDLFTNIFTLGSDSMEKFKEDGVSFFQALKAIGAEACGFTFPDGFSITGLNTLLSALTSVAATMTGVSIGDIFSKMAGDAGTMEKFKTDGVNFFKAIKAIAEEMCGFAFPEDFSQEGFNALLTVLTDTASAMKDMSVADIFSQIAGDEGAIEKFETDGVAFFKALTAISNQMAEATFPESFSTEGLNKLFEILESVADHTLSATWDDIWTGGGTTIEKFQTDGVGLFSALKAISDEASGVTTTSFVFAELAVGALKRIIESVKGIDYSGVEKFTGIGFGTAPGADGPVHDIGVAIKDFGNQVAGIDVAAVDVASNAANRIRNLIANLVGLDYSGVESFKTADIGAAMKDYNDQVSSIDAEVVASSVNSAIKIRNFIAGLVGLDTSGVASFKEAITSLGSISTANFLAAFSKAVPDMYTSGVTMINKLIEGVKSKIGDMTAIGGTAAQNFEDGIGNKTTSIVTKFNSVLSDIIAAGEATYESFFTVGDELMTWLDKGVFNGGSDIPTTFGTVLSSSLTSIEGYWSDFYSAGSYLVDGFAAGISENSYKASAKAAAMASAAYEAARKELDVNSPSKIFRSLGYTVPEGFAMGIDKLSGMAGKSATAMADVAIDGVTSSVSKIAEAINGDIDMQPKIRPVLDLSDVRAGASSIGSMFGFGTSVGLMTNIGAISAGTANSIQNGGNSDVVSALNKLREDISKLGGNNYTINGINYNNDQVVSDAIETLVRYARMERRM